MPTVPRLPDDLFTAALPDWVKLVWLQIRKTQGNGPWAYAHFGTYAEACGKHSTQGSQAVKLLCEMGWLERHPENAKRLRCLVPGLSEVDDSSTSDDEDEQDWVDGSSTGVDRSSTHLDESSTGVDQSSTASESSQGTRKRNPEKESSRARGAAEKNMEPLPDWMDPAVWTDWEQHRREIRKPIKPTTRKHQLRKLADYRDAGHDPEAVLRRSITNGWAGLFPDDSTLAGAGGPPDVRRPAPDARGGGAEVGGPNGAARRAREVEGRGQAVPGPHRGYAAEQPSGHRKSASDRRSEYGYDDAHRDVEAALAGLLGSGPHAGGRDDG